MKYLLFLPFLISCTTYQSFITVTPRTDIPKGTTEFIVYSNLTGIKSALKSATIAYKEHDLGLETEEVLLDEGTRAVYKVYSLDSTSFKVQPFWGVTQKVESEAKIWVGYLAADGMSQDLSRVVYNKDALRPKKVFDYAVQVFTPSGVIDYRKLK